MTYLEYCESHGANVVPGTFSAQQLLARWERDEQIAAARASDFPLLHEYYCCACGAIRYAIDILKSSRRSEKINPSAFIGSFVRLESFIQWLDAMPDQPKALRDWPREAGFVFGGRAGWSALEAAVAFAESIHGGVVVGRSLHRIPCHGEPYASQVAVDDCGPDIVAWCEKSMEELSTKTCPASHVWPTPAELHADAQSIGYKVADEFNRAMEASKKNQQRYVLHDALSDCMEEVERYASLRPRLFDMLASLKDQADGPWSIRYKRNPAEGAPDIAPKVVEHVTTDFKIEGIALEAGVATFRMPETYAPFHDFELVNGEGAGPAEGTELWRIEKRLELLLRRLLETAKRLMRSIEIIEREVTRRGLRADITSLSRLAIAFPVFPYWTPPQGKTLKSMQRQDFDDLLHKESELLDSVRLSLRALANAEAQVLEGADSGDTTTAQLQEQVDAVQKAATPAEKGKTLEKLMVALLLTIDGFVVSGCNVNTETEEIDIVIENRSNLFPWSRQSPIILVECKNWSKPADKNALVSLEKKIKNRRGQCAVGIFIAWSGFTSKAELELLRTSQESWMILTLDGESLKQALTAERFASALHEAWRAAALQ